MVVNIGKVLSGEWDYVINEIRLINEAVISRGAILKVIFENDCTSYVFLHIKHDISLPSLEFDENTFILEELSTSTTKSKNAWSILLCIQIYTITYSPNSIKFTYLTWQHHKRYLNFFYDQRTYLT